MSIIENKIDAAIHSQEASLKTQIQDAIDKGLYNDLSDWLTGNKPALLAKLELQPQEVNGVGINHLKKRLRELLTGEFAFKAATPAPEVFPPQETILESDVLVREETEVLSLKEKIDLLQPLLASYAAEGAASIPACQAYLEILEKRITDPAEQKSLLRKTLQKWQRDFATEWVGAGDLIDTTDPKQIVPEPSYQFARHTGLNGLDTLLDFWTAKKGTVFNSKQTDGIALVGDPENRASIITTESYLQGETISVEPNNPFWAKKDTVTDTLLSQPPQVGERFFSANRRALLVIDCETNPQGRLGTAGVRFTCVDPETGTVFQVSSNEIYQANLKKWRAQQSGDSRQDRDAFQSSFSCGTCWVG